MKEVILYRKKTINLLDEELWVYYLAGDTIAGVTNDIVFIYGLDAGEDEDEKCCLVDEKFQGTIEEAEAEMIDKYEELFNCKVKFVDI